MSLSEERHAIVAKCFNENRAIKIAVATLAGGLGSKEASMATRGVNSAAIVGRRVFRAERVRRANSHTLKSLLKVSSQDRGSPSSTKPPSVPSLSGAAV